MSTQEPNYPCQYRGNTVYDERKVSELSDELLLVTDSREIKQILKHIGVTHDPDSIATEDTYGCLWVNTAHGSYGEVWGIHKTVPYMDRIAVRLK